MIQSERGRQCLCARTWNNQYMERGRHLRMRIMLQNGVVHALNTKVLTEKMAFRRSDYFFLNCGIVHCALKNGADLCVNES